MVKINNIHNKKSQIYLFSRDEKGNLKINKDTSFTPFYYEPDEHGEHIGYDNTPLKKIYVHQPSDVPEQRTPNSYSADVVFCRNYLINRVDEIEKSPLKIFWIDSEMLADELPDYQNPKYRISCITVYNSFDEKYRTFFLRDYKGNSLEEKEKELFNDFIQYFQDEQPDLWLSWNVFFDYNYIFARYSELFNQRRYQNFAKKISPINQVRGSAFREDNIFYPAGISIVDYLKLFKKVFDQELSYSLNNVAKNYLNRPKKYENIDFTTLSDEVKKRNKDDVKIMVEIDEKKNLIEYFDKIRRNSKIEFEDLYYNSRIIDQKFLEEAKKQDIVLPSKGNNTDKEDFEGAFRESFNTGAFYNTGKYDLSGAYLYAVTDLCLDSSNIRHQPSKKTLKIDVTDRKTQDVKETYYIEQNPNTILPKTVHQLLEEKQYYKNIKQNTDQNSPEYKDVCRQYDAIKAVVLSAWGVLGFQSFRLYDHRVASMITSVVRDLLHYVKKNIEKKGYKVLYIDTDSMFCADNSEDITDKLNKLIQEWSQKRFEKDSSIYFENEGRFEKLLIVAPCRYLGYLEGKEDPEVTGIEIKRSDSSAYMANFQQNLIDKILEKESESKIVKWIKKEKERMRELPLEKIGFPSSVPSKDYKTIDKNGNRIKKPLFVRAYNNSVDLFTDFELNPGDSYYWTYILPQKTDKIPYNISALAYTENNKGFITKDIVDWDKMIERNIIRKAKRIFKAMGWNTKRLVYTDQNTLF